MKKYLLILVSLLFISVLPSCTKDGKGETDKGLEGTTWKCIADGENWVATINFVDQSSVSVIESESGNTKTHVGKYSYDETKIIISLDGDWVLISPITGNTMVLTDEEAEISYTFTKQ